MIARRSLVGTIWSDVLTAAVNLPADHPGKDAIITALDAAAYTATKAMNYHDQALVMVSRVKPRGTVPGR